MAENASEDPLTELVVGAIAYHEMYLAFQKAGFSREEAMELVVAALQAGMKEID